LCTKFKYINDMNHIWDKFTENNQGEFLSREVFDDLCNDMINSHYPGRKVLSNNALESTTKHTVIYSTRYFRDELSSSRKGQIRKDFKKFVDFKKANDINTFAWVCCVPYNLTNDEMTWWINWKTKNAQEHEIIIELFDGNTIIDLAQRYSIFEKWFFNQTIENIDKTNNPAPEKLIETTELIELDNKEHTTTEPEKYEMKAEEIEKTKLIITEPETTEQIDEINTDEVIEHEKETIIEENLEVPAIENFEIHYDTEEVIEDEKETIIEENLEVSADENFEIIHNETEEVIEHEKETIIEENIEVRTDENFEIIHNETEEVITEEVIENHNEHNESNEELTETVETVKIEDVKTDEVIENNNKVEENKEKLNQKNPNNNKIKTQQQEKYNTAIYNELKREYLSVLNLSKYLKKEQKDELAERCQNKEWDKIFIKPAIPQLSTIKYFYKAKSFEVRNIYPEAIFFYEILIQQKDFDTILSKKAKEINETIQKLKSNVENQIKELKGDIFYIQNNYGKALENYEFLYNKDKNNKKIAVKYFETLADNQLKNDMPHEAKNNYQEAYNINKNNTKLETKLKTARFLASGKCCFKNPVLKPFNLFVSPFAYLAAHSIDNNPETQKKLNKASKNFYYAMGTLVIIILLIWGFISIANTKKNKLTEVKADKNIETTAKSNSVIPIQALSLADAAILEGDMIMLHISYDKIHMIDTCIFAYNRAMAYEPNNQLAYQKLVKATNYKKEYVELAQTNIRMDSASYFVSMRRISENLQLFKYLFNPKDVTKGKYGYVDTNMKIIIPPIYDFNVQKMYSGVENFNNGLALVYLIQSNNKAKYLRINKQGKIINTYDDK